MIFFQMGEWNQSYNNLRFQGFSDTDKSAETKIIFSSLDPGNFTRMSFGFSRQLSLRDIQLFSTFNDLNYQIVVRLYSSISLTKLGIIVKFFKYIFERNGSIIPHLFFFLVPLDIYSNFHLFK